MQSALSAALRTCTHPLQDLWELKREFKGAKQQEGAGPAGVKPEGGA